MSFIVLYMPYIVPGTLSETYISCPVSLQHIGNKFYSILIISLLTIRHIIGIRIEFKT